MQTFPSEQELRVQRIWRFLSLELSGHFFAEMWVPVHNREEFQHCLRKRIADLDKRGISDVSPGKFNAAIHLDLLSKLSQNDQLLLAHWMRCLYVGGGSDRLAETLWNSLTTKICNHTDEGTIAKNILKPLQAKKVRIQSSLTESLESHSVKIEHSSWDRTLLDTDAKRNAVKTKIDLIASYNGFVLCWEGCCGNLEVQQLESLYEIGLDIATKENMTQLGLPFPGSWRFELMPFLIGRKG